MLDLQAVIIDEAFCAEADDPALAAFIGVPVLQLLHAMRPEELVAWIRACVRFPIGGGPRLISLTSSADGL